jgi:nicotinate-nucleotide pyrophosphorylase (carboxylating)
VLLDNFPLKTIPEAVAMAGSTVETEVSGNVTLANVKSIANCGVNYVSIGALTKNVQAIDMSLLFAF